MLARRPVAEVGRRWPSPDLIRPTSVEHGSHVANCGLSLDRDDDYDDASYDMDGSTTTPLSTIIQTDTSEASKTAAPRALRSKSTTSAIPTTPRHEHTGGRPSTQPRLPPLRRHGRRTTEGRGRGKAQAIASHRGPKRTAGRVEKAPPPGRRRRGETWGPLQVWRRRGAALTPWPRKWARRRSRPPRPMAPRFPQWAHLGNPRPPGRPQALPTDSKQAGSVDCPPPAPDSGPMEGLRVF